MRRRWCVSDDDETQELYRCARVRLAKRTTAGWSLSCAAGIRADSQWPARSIPQCGLPKSGSGSSCVASPWRAANLGRSRLFRRPEPAESRLRAELPALQLQTDPLPKFRMNWALGTPKERAIVRRGRAGVVVDRWPSVLTAAGQHCPVLPRIAHGPPPGTTAARPPPGSPESTHSKWHPLRRVCLRRDGGNRSKGRRGIETEPQDADLSIGRLAELHGAAQVRRHR